MALEGYSIIITGIVRLLTDITSNRITCIQRDLDCIPSVGYFSGQTFTIVEHEILEKKLKQFQTDYPVKNDKFDIAVNNRIDNPTSWYEKLPKFLADC